MLPPVTLPPPIQKAIDQFRFAPQQVLAIGASLIALILLIANALSQAPTVEPRDGQSVIQVVTTDGKTAGVCALGGLMEEKVHYTDNDSIYRTKLPSGTHTIEASCPSATALSSGRTNLEGTATVTVGVSPQVVRITVR